MKAREKFNKKLLVEGRDDQHVIWALCEKFKVDEAFDVIKCEGVDNLTAQIGVRFKQSGLNTLGIIVDADTQLADRWNSIKNSLNESGFNVPDALPAAGLILTREDGVQAGVWIMPDNNLNGMLEDFIAFLVPQDDPLMPVVLSTLDMIEGQNLNKYLPVHKSKAIIHSWLALQEDPGTPLGQSVTKRYLSTDKQLCLSFIDWLKELFE